MKKKAADNFVLLYVLAFTLALFLHIFILNKIQSEASIYLNNLDEAFFSKISGIAPGEINLLLASKYGLVKLKLILGAVFVSLVGRFCYEDKKYFAWRVLSLFALIINLILIASYIYFLVVTGNVAFITCFSLTFYSFAFIYAFSRFIKF